MLFYNHVDQRKFFDETTFTILNAILLFFHLINNDYKREDVELTKPSLIIVIIRMAFLVLSFFGLLTSLRVFEGLSVMASLVSFCLKNLTNFICFFILYNLFFTSLLVVSGKSYEKTGYPEVNHTFINIFDNLRNSLNDFQTPKSEYWDEMRKQYPQNYAPSIVVFSIQMTWFIDIFLMSIILLNLLIAIVGNSYERLVG